MREIESSSFNLWIFMFAVQKKEKRGFGGDQFQRLTCRAFLFVYVSFYYFSSKFPNIFYCFKK